jgi:hypothetical protein
MAQHCVNYYLVFAFAYWIDECLISFRLASLERKQVLQ